MEMGSIVSLWFFYVGILKVCYFMKIPQEINELIIGDSQRDLSSSKWKRVEGRNGIYKKEWKKIKKSFTCSSNPPKSAERAKEASRRRKTHVVY